jgi:hypothetical protein
MKYNVGDLFQTTTITPQDIKGTMFGIIKEINIDIITIEWYVKFGPYKGNTCNTYTEDGIDYALTKPPKEMRWKHYPGNV